MIGCTRMYNVNPIVEGLWKRLLETAAKRAGVPLDVIAYPAPARLAELWSRQDMACVFMCGWPFRRARTDLRIVAAPVPRDGPCEGPYYCTDFIVRAGSAFRRLEDTFGGRIAWTDESSHSGFNAPRRHLLDLRDGRTKLYRESVGPLVTPRASLSSVIDGHADVAPLDSYFHALIRRHEPELAARIRVVAQTGCAPIPPLVASSEVPVDAVKRLGAELFGTPGDQELRPLLEALCLDGFAAIADPDVYAMAEQWDADARAAGYLVPS
jgi:ABC-type phosphate/phosphonate transport system substrate-binding protein